MMLDNDRNSLAHDLVLPTLLFAALGGMTWAVRGCSGYGAAAGCIFAGVMWGAAWWFIARDPGGEQSRRYSSGWIVLAVTVGVGFSGARGWMQWPHFFDNRLYTDWNKQEFVAISKFYGFLWLFIAGMPWAGLGACLLAWCGSIRETRVWHWALRLACGIGGSLLAKYLFDHNHQFFLPLYETMAARYQDLDANPSLRRLINDSRQAIDHLGFYLGFLLYEILRRDWKNVLLISTVGVVNGIGWALIQNWKWADDLWPTNNNFNFWRSWESSGGISIGIAYGVAYYLANRRMSADERTRFAARRSLNGPNFEWLVVFLGLTWFVSFALLRPQGSMWGTIYSALAVVFGAAYYLLHSSGASDQPPDAPRARGIDWIAALLCVAVLAALSIPGREMYPYRHAFLAWIFLSGIAWYFTRRGTFDAEKVRTTPLVGDANLERFGLYAGLLMGLGFSIRSGLKGWFNIFVGDEDYWSAVLWQILGPIYLVLLLAIVIATLFWPVPRKYLGDLFPRAYGLMWLVLIVQNILAQLVTGHLDQWNEFVFRIYYMLLFAITAVITFHYQFAKTARITSLKM